jgi:hypothetical protein
MDINFKIIKLYIMKLGKVIAITAVASTLIAGSAQAYGWGYGGTTYSTYGNQTYGSDGSTYSTYGNTTYGSWGYGSYGSSTCTTYGTQTYCN